jgi:hypothetical protein
MTATEVLRKKVMQYIDTADQKALKKVQSILEESADGDWWDDVPQNIQILVEQAIKEGETGKGTPHEEVMAKYSRWFKK